MRPLIYATAFAVITAFVPTAGQAQRIWARIRNLPQDEEGSILVLFTLVVFIMMGMVGLALDGGRLYALNNQMQDLADAAALAGAKELNGEDDAMDRATARAQNLLSNTPTWAEVGSTGVQIGTPLFFKGPGPTDNPAGPLEGKYARFIQVTTIDRAVIPTLLRAIPVLLGSVDPPSNAQTRATAVAGSGMVACNTQPMMLCNPFEPNEFTATRGQMFHLKPKGAGSTTFGPGDFGLVDPPGTISAGAPDIRALLSQQSPALCYGNEVNPRTGHAVEMVKDGINIRFDRPPHGGGPNVAAMDLTAAPNVLDAFEPGNPSCNKWDAAIGQKLPRDPVLTPVGGVEIGTGPTKADLDAYWQSHYGSNWPVGLPLTRYDGYLRELGLNGTAPAVVAGSEARGPTCQTNSNNERRRVISVSIVDCLHWAVRGNAVNQIWSSKYADFFITEPSEDGSVHAEFIEEFIPGSGASFLHHIVQLYR